MKTSRLITLALPLALLSACGGSTGSTGSTQSFQNAAPSYEALAMDLTTGDAAAGALTLDTQGASAALRLFPIADLTCHPHLFLRTHDVVKRVNRHLERFLGRVSGVIRRNPDITDGNSKVWERVADGIDVKFTMTHDSDTVYSWKLELKKVDAADFTTVFTGSVDRAGATGPHQGVGSMKLDLDALASVTAEPLKGVLTATFDVSAAKRLVVFDAAGVVWDQDDNDSDSTAPRSAHYVYEREPGKGGSLKIEENMVFLCPANAALVPADVKLVSRWYVTSAGTVHGRSDALMTGGQLADGFSVVGLTCHQGVADAADQVELAWLMKEEDATGATVVGGLKVTGGDVASACDPLLNPPAGAVPSLDDNATDFQMGAVDFTDPTPYPFPAAQ